MITLIIAIIGAITGILALIIQYIDYKKTNVKLKVKLENKKSFYTTGDKIYKCKYFCVVSIKISNCSALPITIDEAEIKYKNKHTHYFNEKKKINKKHIYDDNSYTELNLYEQPQLPLRIDCYDTVFLSFIFPFFDEYVNNEFEFFLKTPRKDYKWKIKLNEFESIFDEK